MTTPAPITASVMRTGTTPSITEASGIMRPLAAWGGTRHGGGSRRGAPWQRRWWLAAGQQPLGEVEPLLELRDALLENVYVAQAVVHLIELALERRIEAGLPFQPARDGTRDGPADD